MNEVTATPVMQSGKTLPTRQEILDADINLSVQEQKNLLILLSDQQGDLKLLKHGIVKTLSQLGIVDKDGNTTDRIDFKSLFATVKGFLWDKEKAAKEFEFLKELAPLVEKYKHL